MIYHAGLAPAERERAHNSFLTGQCNVVVATIAFGMGIDKPDIRTVFHYGPPKTVEEYYQQIGRAGETISNALEVHGMIIVSKVAMACSQNASWSIKTTISQTTTATSI